MKKQKLGLYLKITWIFFSLGIHIILTPLKIPSVSYSSFDSRKVPFDHKLAKIMNFKNGTFIEVGAFDGIMYSNTKMFEEFYGWTGILIEPSQVLFSRLFTNRPNSKCFQCALGSFEEHGTYAYGNFDGGPMSGFYQQGFPKNDKVFIRSLQSILDECGLHHITFFSLDVEGYELNVLRGIDFNKTTFDYILVEITLSQYNEVVSFLADNGYEMIYNFSNYNKVDNPTWDKTINDFLFKRKTLKEEPDANI